MNVKFLLPLALLLFSNTIFGQQKSNQETHYYNIKRTNENIKVDGDLNEAIWQELEVASDFWYSFPFDDKIVEEEFRTEVKVTYDDRFIYIGAVCHGKGPFVIPSLKRENSQFWDGDAFSVVFDPVNEKTNGFAFATNPSGVQFETLISGNTGTRSNPSSTGFNSAWDNKWVVNSTVHSDRWVTEIAIPFKTLKYGDKTQWGINFLRGVSKTNSWQTWAPVPVQFVGVDLGYTGMLQWSEQPPKAKSNISVIPYILGSGVKDIENDEPIDYKFEVGGDAKIAINSNLNLDLTINPDFSQVDVDEQVTNLTTVNIRFPERRLFFLENSDVFADFGIPPMRPFFSRRIGLDEEGSAIPILYGARLSGNMTKDLRIGIMNLQTGESDDFLGQNYTALAFNQRLFGRTIFKGYFHNRQAFQDGEFSSIDYNRSLGGELDYRSLSGQFRANIGYGMTMNEGLKGENQLLQGVLTYNNRNIYFYTNLVRVGDNYLPDVGFITQLFHYDAETDTEHRLGYTHSYTNFVYSIFPENEKINKHDFSAILITDQTVTSKELFNAAVRGSYRLNFASTASIEVEGQRSFRKLLYPFGFTDDNPLPADKYNWEFIGATYQSDLRKRLFYELGFQWGTFYNGTRRQFSFGLNYRQQPWGNFGLRFERNNLDFPEEFGSTALTLIGPRIEINMSRDLFWTTFLQYNTQRDNFNINSRLQWQFQPLSNLFIVYTDNYAIDVFGPKNRALVVKLNYWLNI